MSLKTKDIFGDIKAAIVTITIIAAIVSFFYYIDFFVGVSIIYGHYLAGFFLVSGFLLAAFEKTRNKEVEGVLSFFSIIVGAGFLISFCVMHYDFNNIRLLEPKHISIVKVDEAFDNKNISLAIEANSFSTEVHSNNKELLIMISKLEKNKEIDILVKQDFISKKEFEKIKYEFLEKHQNTNDNNVSMLVALLKQKVRTRHSIY